MSGDMDAAFDSRIIVLIVFAHLESCRCFSAHSFIDRVIDAAFDSLRWGRDRVKRSNSS